MKRKKLSLLTTPEIEHIKALANFTELQGQIFGLLVKDKSDTNIMMSLYISNRRLYGEKRIIYDKAHRVLGDDNPLGI
jgi:hypothetical protein